MSRNTFFTFMRLPICRHASASRLLSLITLIGLLLGSHPVSSQVVLPDIRITKNPIKVKPPLRHLAKKVLVRLRPGVSPTDFAQFFTAAASGKSSPIKLAGINIGLPRLNALKHDHTNASIHWSSYTLPSPTYLKATVNALRQCPDVVWAEPDYPIKRLGQTPLTDPNDTYWKKEDLEHLIVVLSGLDTPDTARDDDSASWTYTWSLETVSAFDAWNVYPGHYHTASERATLYQTNPGALPLVAVIDSGVDMTHPDFSYTGNPDSGTTDTDVVNGGQINHALARNFVNGNTDTNPDLAKDDIGHGTSVAGIIAAAPNDSAGIPGLAFPAQIVPIKVIDADGNGLDSDLIDAITYAVDKHCLVINTSLTLDTTEFPQALQEAVDYAWKHGTLIVSAAGNDGANSSASGAAPIPALGLTRRYPASLVHVLGVSATTYGGDGTNGETLTSYSNYGYGLGVAAPGGDVTNFVNTSPNGATLGLDPLQEYVLIWTLAPTYQVLLSDPAATNPDGVYAQLGLYGQYGPVDNGPYGYVPGTSFACPHVTALAALYAAAHKITQATPNAPQLLIDAVEKGCDPMNARSDGGWDPNFGYGRINAAASVQDLNPRNATVGGFIGQVTVYGTPIHNVQVTATSVATGKKYYAATFPDGIYHVTNVPDGKYVVAASALGYSGQTTIQLKAGSDLHGVSFALPMQPLRIHCGGTSYTTASGAIFDADKFYVGGSAFSWKVPATTDRALYGTVRYDAMSFGYNLPVGAGNYTLRLYFDEGRPYTIGQRLFNVSVNGSAMLSKFDIVAEAGGKWGKPVVKTFTVSSDGSGVSLKFSSVKGAPILSAIELIPAAP